MLWQLPHPLCAGTGRDGVTPGVGSVAARDARQSILRSVAALGGRAKPMNGGVRVSLPERCTRAFAAYNTSTTLSTLGSPLLPRYPLSGASCHGDIRNVPDNDQLQKRRGITIDGDTADGEGSQ